MKRISIMLLLFVFSIVMVACDDSNTSVDNEDSDKNESNDVNNNNENTPENENNENAEEVFETEEGNAVGDTITNEGGESTLVSLNNDIDVFKSGPIVLNIEKANGVHMKVENDEFKDLFDGKDELEYIQVDMEVENTKEEPVNFYADQATMTTNTGEQLESDMILSDHINGEFLDAVTQSGSIYYFLETSKAEDVESITLHIDGASNDNFETIGDDLKIEIDLNK